MAQRTFNRTERLGVNAVADIVTRDLGWIWREQQVLDFGVDGEIEAVANDGKPTGQLFAVQIKSGPSYFHGTRETIPHSVSDEHLKYWNRHSLPVILVLHNPEDRQTLWQWADLKTARCTARRWCIDVPKAKVFSATSKAELLGQVWQDDSIGLRRRFAFDRQLMKRVQVGRSVFVTVDLQLNKTLSFREIQIRFNDPDKETPDYVIPIMVTWHYEINDLMHHFLPWLDYGYYGEPESCAEEVERYVMEVWLSNPAKAFLELEAFFDSGGTSPVSAARR